MCGIFGVVLRPGAAVSKQLAKSTLESLLRLSESRGKESAGLHIWLPSIASAWTIKGAVSAHALMHAHKFHEALDSALTSAYGTRDARIGMPLVMIGHSRLVTNGAAERIENNQPVRRDAVTIIHNGIVVNVDSLWDANRHLERHAEVDTEVVAALLLDAVARPSSLAAATRYAYSAIRGSASIAWIHDRYDAVTLATNTGDLYHARDENIGAMVFASEKFILVNALNGIPELAAKLTWMPPGSGLSVSPKMMSEQSFLLTGADEIGAHVEEPLSGARAADHDIVVGPSPAGLPSVNAADERLLRYGESRLRAMRRCSRCVLPETFPYINFDAEGVCNYCRNYTPRYKGMDPDAARRRFMDSMLKYRSTDGSADALVAFSGGRDSSYGLHLIKRELGLTPVTFTYDWGMVTDLARRNIARICGQLGIQNILVSANIRRKRENIRKNVAAWLRRPDLGLVPLFMAGDKHFFRVANQLKRQTGIKLDIWCANPLENTDFKSGLCGVGPDFEKKGIEYLSFGNKFKMGMHYMRQFAANPALINASLLDTSSAFWSYYFEPRVGFHLLFDHIVWNESQVNNVLLREYNWEVAEDTTSTWRIGDGTAPFYNYIYVTALGFSEFDTFRSNQIREGMLMRNDALNSILVENRPRFASIRWYLDTIGLPFDESISAINRLDILGLHR